MWMKEYLKKRKQVKKCFNYERNREREGRTEKKGSREGTGGRERRGQRREEEEQKCNYYAYFPHLEYNAYLLISCIIVE